MEWMQPRIDDAQRDQKRDRVRADRSRARVLAEHLAFDRLVDRELENVHEGEDRAEGKIGDNH
jgi:hypothetical protein